jgi:putative ABC transport system permease protein
LSDEHSRLRRFYRLALRFFPVRVRDAHGAEMEEMFVDDWNRARALGMLATVGAVARLARDVLVNGLGARFDRKRGGGMWGLDLRVTLRALLRRPGYSLVAIGTLALGIGGNTAIYSIVDAAYLDALPYPDDHELVVPYNSADPSRGGGFAAFSAPFYSALRDVGVFQAVADIVPRTANVGGEDSPERVPGALVSASFFDVAQVQPFLGRAFTEEEAGPGGPDVVVLSHGLWQRRFGADAAIVGQTAIINDQPTTVVGVMPVGFSLLFDRVELWTPTHTDEATFNRTAALNNDRIVVARLPSGVSIETVEPRLRGAVERLQERFPATFEPEQSVRLVPLRNHLYGSARTSLFVLLGAVGLVLLIACANMANLQLVRGASRRGELAVRLALGAGSGRLIRGMLLESVVLSILGAGAGVLIAAGVVEAIRPLAPASVPLPTSGVLDGSVLLFTLVLAVGTGVIFALIPAWSVVGSDLRNALGSAGRSDTSPSGRSHARSALVVAEVAMTAVLLVGAGLMLNSLARLQNVDAGFDREDRVLVPVALPRTRYPDAASIRLFHQRLLEETTNLPAVASAGLGQFLPLTGASNWGFEAEGQEAGVIGFADYTLISPGYLDVVGQRVIRGRDLTWNDSEADAPPVVLVSEAMAKRLWPGQDPLGRRLNVDTGDAMWREVVGVVSDVRNRALAQEPGDIMYFPTVALPMSGPRAMSLVVHYAANEAPLTSLRSMMASLDPTIPVSGIRPLESIARSSETRRLFMMTLLGIFAGIALVLAGVGLFGVVSYSFAQRKREIGLRMAVGASRGAVLWMVVRQSAVLLGFGLLVGLGGASVLTRFVEPLLYDVGRVDPLTYLAVAAFLTAITALATWLPARRATSIAPASVLRE